MERTKMSVAVIGAGLGGLAIGAKLKEAGYKDFWILEKAASVGGTWRDNTYPGCSCDVPAILYAYSFAPNLDWSHRYARGPEIRQYAESLVDQFGLRGHLRLGDGAASALWIAEEAQWRVTTEMGVEYRVDAVITALGQLSVPNLPNIAGAQSFAGPSFHSARWDNSVELDGKRVGVIGSAASAIQIIPEVAKIASQLNVFQRTPNWVIPRGDYPISPEYKALIRSAPHVAQLTRQMLHEEADHLTWQGVAWTEVGRAAIGGLARAHLEAQVADPVLREKLTPKYPVLCKRILISDDFYPTLLRDNVELIAEPINKITRDAVVTADEVHHACDVLIFATGFHTTDWRWSIDVVGRDGQRLTDVWKGGAEAYLGTTVAGFPNLFMVSGPNTSLGHTSQTIMIELQADYIIRALNEMRERGIASMEVGASAQRRFNTELQAQLAKTSWADPRCMSWYKLADGRITQSWGSHTRAFGEATRAIQFDDYVLKNIAPALT